MKNKAIALIVMCFLLMTIGCASEKQNPKQMMTKKEMDNLKVGEKIKSIKKEIDQEYLESKDLIAIYTFSYKTKYTDGNEKTGTLISSEGTMNKYETDELSTTYALVSLEIKKIEAYYYTNQWGLDPFGGRYANISYNEYFNENKEKIIK